MHMKVVGILETLGVTSCEMHHDFLPIPDAVAGMVTVHMHFLHRGTHKLLKSHSSPS